MAATYILGSINQSRGPAFELEPGDHHGALARLQSPMPSITNFVYPHLTWSTLWFTLLCVFVVFNLKNLPFMWHMRILNAFRFTLRTQRSPIPLSSAHIFQPIITTSTAQLMEIDFNIHKTNSSYFSDIDVSRAHLTCTLFAKGIEQMRGGTGAYTGSGKPLFGLALGAVSCHFKRELLPYEEYEMWSKILTWDEKWIYIVTHFVRKGAASPKSYSLYPEQSPGHDGESSGSSSDIRGTDSKPGEQIIATALSKCVFKSGRKTISPELMLHISGLLPDSDDSKAEMQGMTRQEVEGQRIKGLQLVQLFSEQQPSLDAEFGGTDCEALARHNDGAGISGVVSTLMQLAHLKRTQAL
ncbi:hypothetical protein GGS23DRAFT_47587 [Durotheca rogersii]|uniref:uncharacterized protein n=1 Tax=Durotheca rogersii TaxID=419775 RepID=UPI00221F384A|nr:uncharacterized protein GGS23DRAFT_47587 [Durotheca rogersii]KAI5863002.1 hypothetical protein GGS23DRAFT_47587 [Durotheca rogersii]